MENIFKKAGKVTSAAAARIASTMGELLPWVVGVASLSDIAYAYFK